MQNFLKQSALYGIGFIFSRLQVFLLLPLLVGHLNQSDYGIYETLSTLTVLATTLCVFNFDSGLSSFFHTQKTIDEKKDLVSTGLFSILIWSALLIFLAYLFQNVGAGFFVENTQFGVLFLKAVALGGLQSICHFLNVCLRQKFQASKYNFLVSLQTFPSLIIIYSFSKNGLLNLNNVFDTLIIVNFAAVLAGLFLNGEIVRPRFKISIFKSLLEVALPLLPFSFFAWSLSLFDRLILTHLLGLESVAVYSFAMRIASISSTLLGPFQIAWPPHGLKLISEHKEQETFPKVLSIFLLLSGSLVVIIGFSAPLIYQLLAPQSYMVSAKYVGILAFCTLLNSLYYFPVVIFLDSKKTWTSTISFFIGSSLNVILNFILIPHLGIAGAVYANLIGYSFLFGSAFYLAQRIQKIKYNMRDLILKILLIIFFVILPVFIY